MVVTWWIVAFFAQSVTSYKYLTLSKTYTVNEEYKRKQYIFHINYKIFQPKLSFQSVQCHVQRETSGNNHKCLAAQKEGIIYLLP